MLLWLEIGCYSKILVEIGTFTYVVYQLILFTGGYFFYIDNRPGLEPANIFNALYFEWSVQVPDHTLAIYDEYAGRIAILYLKSLLHKWKCPALVQDSVKG